jgi:hypothetical protein
LRRVDANEYGAALRHRNLSRVLHLRKQLVVKRAGALDRARHARSCEDRDYADDHDDHDQLDQRKSAAIKKGACRLLSWGLTGPRNQLETAMIVAVVVAPPALW